jgi:gluconate:H+ symporter, GntP family
MALAIGSGALFALQVNSNFFWKFQSLLEVTTQRAFKALTLVTALASVVSLVLILPLRGSVNRRVAYVSRHDGRAVESL